MCFKYNFLLFDSMEEGAADRCKEAIDKALQYDEHNPEALQLMASYLFSIEKTEVQQDICGVNYPEFPHRLAGSLKKSVLSSGALCSHN